MFIARNTPAFVIAYLALMVPTYILPYFGSNSAVVNVFSAAMGMGPTPQWWMHVWFLIMLAVLGWLRGSVIGKAYLPVFPVIAGVFDMTPGLSMIPMIPTVMHLVGVILGAMGAAALVTDGEFMLARRAKIVAGVATLLAIGGSVLFVSTALSKSHSLSAPVAKTLTTPKIVSTPVRAVAEVKPQSVPTVAQTIPEPSPVVSIPTTAAPVSETHKHHRAVSEPKAAVTKSANPEKQTVRYLNLNE